MNFIVETYNIKRCKCGKVIDNHINNSCLRCRRLAVRRRIEIKDIVFSRYGGYVCSCCNDTMKESLQIDHVDNNGAEHRRITNCGTGNSFYRWLKRNNYPEGYQVLCASCNVAKQMNNGICPHQQERERNE